MKIHINKQDSLRDELYWHCIPSQTAAVLLTPVYDERLAKWEDAAGWLGYVLHDEYGCGHEVQHLMNQLVQPCFEHGHDVRHDIVGWAYCGRCGASNCDDNGCPICFPPT